MKPQPLIQPPATPALAAYTVFGDGSWWWLILLWALFAAMVVPNLIEVRREKITKPLLAIYRKMLPSMSSTEREALEAGSVWWDGELFSGMPEWDRLMKFPAPELSEEERAFIDGPCEELCEMLDEWEISHERGDLPEHVWQFIKVLVNVSPGLGFDHACNATTARFGVPLTVVFVNDRRTARPGSLSARCLGTSVWPTTRMLRLPICPRIRRVMTAI